MTWQLPPIHDTLKASAGLVAIVGDRIFQTKAAETAARPYLVWSITTSQAQNILGDTPREDDMRVTVQIFAEDQATARRAIQFAVDAVEADIGDLVFGPADLFDPITKLSFWFFDVEVWNDRAN